MSKDIDRAFLFSITCGLDGWGDIDCICAVIGVFLLRRGYHCKINVISRENDSGHATIECLCYDGVSESQKRAITVWHSQGWYNACRGISGKEWPDEEETVEFSSYIDDYYGTELLDFLDSVFPGPADQDEGDYFSELFSGRIGSAENEACAQAENDERQCILDYVASCGRVRRDNLPKRYNSRRDLLEQLCEEGILTYTIETGGKGWYSVTPDTDEAKSAARAAYADFKRRKAQPRGAAKGKKKLTTAERCYKYLTNQDDVERIIFCALLDLMEDARNLLYFANVIFALLMWRGYQDAYTMITPCARHISLNVPFTILSDGLMTCIEISDGDSDVDSCVLKVAVNKQNPDNGRIYPNAAYEQPINRKYAPSFKGNTYDGLYDFLSEKFPRQYACYSNVPRMPAHLNLADLQSCFSSRHADVELDPIRFYPRSLTKEIYKLEKANNGQVICRICNKPIEAFSDCSADHIVPYSKGGKTTLSNMQLAHKSCNSKKRDKIKSDDENWIV